MKKILFALLISGLLTSTSWATTVLYDSSLSFNLTATNEPEIQDGRVLEPGIGSVNMDLSITEKIDGTYQLIATLENASPLATSSDPAFLNIPGIVGFGFNFAAPKPALQSWDLHAQQYLNGALHEIDLEQEGIWEMVNEPLDQTTKVDGFNLDMGVVNSLDGSHNALYNPELLSLTPIPDALAVDSTNSKQIPYFTTATLTLNFNHVQAIPIDVYVRMQRVGENQEGSLKLTGLFYGWETGNPVLVPEPGTVVLLGLGLVGLGLLLRKRSKRT